MSTPMQWPKITTEVVDRDSNTHGTSPTLSCRTPTASATGGETVSLSSTSSCSGRLAGPRSAPRRGTARMTDRGYADPVALRQAITDRLRQLAQERPGAQLTDLQRQFAYDRLLVRLFTSEPDAWVLKGATALLARMRGSARHTVDVDLYRQHGSLDSAEAALHAAAAIDLGDFFRFALAPGRHGAAGRTTLRIRSGHTFGRPTSPASTSTWSPTSR